MGWGGTAAATVLAVVLPTVAAGLAGSGPRAGPAEDEWSGGDEAGGSGEKVRV